MSDQEKETGQNIDRDSAVVALSGHIPDGLQSDADADADADAVIVDGEKTPEAIVGDDKAPEVIDEEQAPLVETDAPSADGGEDADLIQDSVGAPVEDQKADLQDEKQPQAGPEKVIERGAVEDLAFRLADRAREGVKDTWIGHKFISAAYWMVGDRYPNPSRDTETALGLSEQTTRNSILSTAALTTASVTAGLNSYTFSFHESAQGAPMNVALVGAGAFALMIGIERYMLGSTVAQKAGDQLRGKAGWGSNTLLAARLGMAAAISSINIVGASLGIYGQEVDQYVADLDRAANPGLYATYDQTVESARGESQVMNEEITRLTESLAKERAFLEQLISGDVDVTSIPAVVSLEVAIQGLDARISNANRDVNLYEQAKLAERTQSSVVTFTLSDGSTIQNSGTPGQGSVFDTLQDGQTRVREELARLNAEQRAAVSERDAIVSSFSGGISQDTIATQRELIDSMEVSLSQATAQRDGVIETLQTALDNLREDPDYQSQYSFANAIEGALAAHHESSDAMKTTFYMVHLLLLLIEMAGMIGAKAMRPTSLDFRRAAVTLEEENKKMAASKLLMQERATLKLINDARDSLIQGLNDQLKPTTVKGKFGLSHKEPLTPEQHIEILQLMASLQQGGHLPDVGGLINAEPANDHGDPEAHDQPVPGVG